MLRPILIALFALAHLAGPLEAQTFTLPELGLQNSGACRQLAARDRTSNAMIALGCLDTVGKGWNLTPKAIQIQGAGSTGDVSGMGALAPGGTVLRSFADRASDRPSMLDVANCDGTNETTKIQAYLNSRPFGSVVRLPAGKWCFVTDLDIPAGVTVQGAGGIPANPGGTNQGVTLGQVGGLYLEKTGTITLHGASGLRHAVVLRADSGVPMKLPAADGAAYAGDCITAAAPSGAPGAPTSRGADGYEIDDVLCVGQSRALVSIGASRATIGRFAFDVNPGAAGRAAVTLANSGDTIRVRDLHGWPYGRSDKTGNLLRSVGTGLLIQGQMDGLQIDGALLINFDIEVDFANTGAIDIGRLWVDTGITDVPGTRGVRFGANVTNVNIGLLETWGHEIGLESAGGAGNRNSIGIAHFENQYGYPLAVGGGSLHIGNATIRNSPTRTQAIALNNPASFLSGLFNIEVNLTVPPVFVAAGITTDKVADLRVVAPYLPAGTPIFGGNPMSYTIVSATDPIMIPTHTDEVKITGAVSAGNIAGGSHGRIITIKSTTAGGTLYSGGNVLTATGGNRAMNAGSIIKLQYDADLGKWIEIFYRP